MLFGLGIILILGIMIDLVFKKINVPSLIGYIILGIGLGPYVFNILNASLLEISHELRQIILIIIITRAGLSLDLNDLKKVGIPAILLSFVPAYFEILGVMFFAPKIFAISRIDALLLGTVLAAVSPAVVVPRMIKLIEDKKGVKKRIPQLVLAGASIDDIYALILFSIFISLTSENTFNITTIFHAPLSILLGIISGGIIGFLLAKVFEKIKLHQLHKVLILFGLSLLLVSLESFFIFSGILSVMSLALMLRKKNLKHAVKIAQTYNQLWVVGEIFLFVLVGASVNIHYAINQGFYPVLLILFGLFFRMVGVWISLLSTNLYVKEKVFVLIAYTPKATVQAAIGGIPLALGLRSGELILSVSVVAILITAPLGAMAIDYTADKLLS